MGTLPKEETAMNEVLSFHSIINIPKIVDGVDCQNSLL